jgi:hypothetical protein
VTIWFPHLFSPRAPRSHCAHLYLALDSSSCVKTHRMAKRKNQAPSNGQVKKKRAISDDEAHKNFRSGLFDSKVLAGYTDYYAKSQPYALHNTLASYMQI